MFVRRLRCRCLEVQLTNGGLICTVLASPQMRLCREPVFYRTVFGAAAMLGEASFVELVCINANLVL